MEKHLLLLRHAKAQHEPGLDDHDRPLSVSRGAKQCLFIADYLTKHAYIPDYVLSSDAARTMQTAQNILQSLNHSQTIHPSSPLYLAPAGQILKSIATIPEQANCALVVGHNPGIHQLADWLCQKKTADYPTACLAIFKFSGTHWSAVEASNCTPVALIHP